MKQKLFKNKLITLHYNTFSLNQCDLDQQNPLNIINMRAKCPREFTNKYS